MTVILTTHYIDEAEEMADRIGVIDKRALVVVDENTALMRSLGTKQLTVHLARPLAEMASIALTAAFFGVCLAVVAWISRTGYRLRA